MRPLPAWATAEEREAYVRCEQVVAALKAKGLTAFYGPIWDGASDHHADAPFWYCHPQSNGGVGLYHEYNPTPGGGLTYDAGELGPEDAEGCLGRLAALPEGPSRQQVWDAVSGAQDRDTLVPDGRETLVDKPKDEGTT